MIIWEMYILSWLMKSTSIISKSFYSKFLSISAALLLDPFFAYGIASSYSVFDEQNCI